MIYKTINNKNMPMVGFGTWKITDSDAENAVYQAIKTGYRHIDTASIYKNEQGVGKGIKKSGVAREDIFITTKVWLETNTYEGVLKEFENSCNLLDTDYIDLYLIHWPTQHTAHQWKALEELYDMKKAHAIGVCNFHQHHLEDLDKYAKHKPAINQIELHPRLSQKDLLSYNSKHNIITEAWSPLMKGRVLENKVVKNLAQKHGKSEAQIVLRWHLQNEVVIIPKTIHQNRMIENMDIFDFSLTKEEMMLIDSLNHDDRVGGNPDVYAQEKFGY